MKPYPTQEYYLNSLRQSVKENIHDAIRFGSSETVLELLNKDPTLILCESSDGSLPLHSACARGDNKIIKILLKFGCNVNVGNRMMETPLHIAVLRGNMNVVNGLILNGADVYSIDVAGNTVLHRAAEGGNIFLIHYLLETCGLNLRSTNKLRNTVLHVACSNGHFTLVDFLLKKFKPIELCDQNVNGNTALHLAVLHGGKEIVFKLLEKAGTTSLLYIANGEGFTAFDLARQGQKIVHKNIAEKLKNLMTSNSLLSLRSCRRPNVLWWSYLLGPFLFYPLVLLICSSFENQGPPMLVALIIILVANMFSSHRINHVLRWPSPFPASLFASGLCYTSLYFIIEVVYYVISEKLFLVSLLFILTIIGIHHYTILLKSDPGQVTQPRMKQNGEPYTILDVANGTLSTRDFCWQCELVQPLFAHHCNLCGKCFKKYDHHCLFLYSCIASKNHMTFVRFIVAIAGMMLLFLCLCIPYIQANFPEHEFDMELVGYIFSSCPTLWSLMILNFMSFIWIIWLLSNQLKVISRGGIPTYVVFKTKSRLNMRQTIMNVINFFLRKPPYVIDPSIVELIGNHEQLPTLTF